MGYNQVPHLTRIPHGKMTKSQLNITNESQEGIPFPAGDHKAAINSMKLCRTQDKTQMIHKEAMPLNGQQKRLYF